MARAAERLEVRRVEDALDVAGGRERAHRHDVVDVARRLGPAGGRADRAERVYAEGIEIARGLRDGTLPFPPPPFRSMADAAEYAVLGAQGRGWEAPPDVVALAKTAESSPTASGSTPIVGTANIDRRLWTCPQRLEVERLLREAGHVWPADSEDGAMSAAECIARIAAYLDASRGDADALARTAVLEQRAGWTGRPGLLVEVLTCVGWIHVELDGSRRWESFGVAFHGESA